MESTKCENNTIEHNKQALSLIIKEFRKLIDLYKFRTDKKTLKILRNTLRKYEKIACDEKEGDIEYLKRMLITLKNLKNTYFNRNKYYDYRVKYFVTDETIKYLFEDGDEDYNIYKINQQYQSFSNKTLLPLNEYLKKIRPELIRLLTNDHEVEPDVNLVFRSRTNSNDEFNMFIKTKSANIDEILNQLIKKKDLTNIGFF